MSDLNIRKHGQRRTDGHCYIGTDYRENGVKRTKIRIMINNVAAAAEKKKCKIFGRTRNLMGFSRCGNVKGERVVTVLTYHIDLPNQLKIIARYPRSIEFY